MVDVWQIPKCVSGLQGKIEQLAKQTRKPILFLTLVPASIYLFKRNNGNLGTMCEVCSELTTKTSLTFSWCLYCEFRTDFAYCSRVSIVELEQICSVCAKFSLKWSAHVMFAWERSKFLRAAILQNTSRELILLLLNRCYKSINFQNDNFTIYFGRAISIVATKRPLSNFVSHIKRILANSLTSIPPDIIR